MTNIQYICLNIFQAAMDKGKLIYNYFRIYDVEFPPRKVLVRYGNGFFAFGLFLIVMMYLGHFQNLHFLAGMSLALGTLSVWWKFRPYLLGKKIFMHRPFDDDMDEWLMEDFHETVKPRALELLKINASALHEENILIVPYPIFWEEEGIDPETIFRRKGNDGKYAYSVWRVQILILTENFISLYSCNYNWPNNEMTAEQTNEYFFDDISSVQNAMTTFKESFFDDEEAKIGRVKTFKLTNRSSGSLTIFTEIPKLEAPDLTITNLEDIVQALRIMLRNRRYGEEVEKAPEPPETSTEEDIPMEVKTAKHLYHKDLREQHVERSKELELIRKEKGKGNNEALNETQSKDKPHE